MGTEPLERKLAAILYADIAGYSRLTSEDEEGTHRALSAYLDTLTTSIERHNGKVLHYAGDAVLAEFGQRRQRPDLRGGHPAGSESPQRTPLGAA